MNQSEYEEVIDAAGAKGTKMRACKSRLFFILLGASFANQSQSVASQTKRSLTTLNDTQLKTALSYNDS